MTPTLLPGEIPDPRMIHDRLLGAFGRRGWWPLEHRAGQPGFDSQGYQLEGIPEDFGVQDIWCVFAGAVLTQRSTWVNARRSLVALLDLIPPGSWKTGMPDRGFITGMDVHVLEEAIRPSGFYRQKARRLGELECLLWERGFFDPSRPCPPRRDLLSLPGLGPESADVLWTYARLGTGFVSDAYTSRIFTRLSGSPEGAWTYQACQSAVLAAWNVAADPGQTGLGLPEAKMAASRNTSGNQLRDFHALLVELGKSHCRASPRCAGCPLSECCASVSGG